MRIADKREQRLMIATPEALETERSSIQRFADKMEIDRGIGLLDAGGLQLERELLDWRIDTFNQALDRRPDLKMEAIDGFSVYTDAAAKELERREAAEQSYREQSQELVLESAEQNVPIERRELDIATVPIKELQAYKEQLDQRWKEVSNAPNYPPHIDIIDRSLMVHQAIRAREQGLDVNQSDRAVMMYAETKAAERLANDDPGMRDRLQAQKTAYLKEHGYAVPPSELSKAETAQMTAQRIVSETQPEPLAELLAGQETNIREEWLSDLQAGRLDRHALDSYFAGRVDQHNTLIGMAVEAHPHLRETLPPPIQYGQIRDDLQQQIAQLAQQQIERNSQAAEQQFRFAL